jgi:hypothetical protein
MEKRLTALKIISAAGLMSLVLLAVCWQPGVTVWWFRLDEWNATDEHCLC